MLSAFAMTYTCYHCIFSAVVLGITVSAFFNLDMLKMTFRTGIKNRNTTSPMIMTCDITNQTQCERICALTRLCKSFFYNPSTGVCQFHGVVLDLRMEGAVQTGLQYYFHWCTDTLEYAFDADTFMCYKIYRELKTWSEAEKVCIGDGGHLIKLDTEARLHLIWKQIRYLSIGAEDVNHDGQWKWLDGTAVTADLWAEDEPSGDGYCMNLFERGRPNDCSCEYKQSFACEITV